MSVSFVSSVKQFLLFILHVVFTVVMGVIAWASWGLYGEEKLANQYQQEGELKMVTVTDLNMVKQGWTDYLGNVEYISFVYKGKPYTARYVESPTYVSRGDQVQLLYDARLDAFRQPEKLVNDAVINKSRLIDWTSLSLFSRDRLSLMACGMVSVAFFFLLSGLVARIPGLGFLRSVNGFVFTMLLLAGTVFLTYDTAVYYRYYHHIKESGERAQVVVLETDRYQLTKNTRTDNFPLYGYSAWVRFRDAERVIPISESDYETLIKGSNLEVYYDASVDDMMAADYSMEYSILFFTGIVWLLLLYAVGRWMGRMKRKRGVQ